MMLEQKLFLPKEIYLTLNKIILTITVSSYNIVLYYTDGARFIFIYILHIKLYVYLFLSTLFFQRFIVI